MTETLTLSQVPQGAEALVLAGLTAKVILHISASDREMARLVQGLEFFAPEREIIKFPSWDTLPYDRSSPNHVIVSQRVEALAKLSTANGERRTVIATTINAVLQKLPLPEVFKTSALVLEKGGVSGREDILKYLVRNGYERVSKVIEPGEYAVRGSIIDLFPSGYDDAVRIDYFGDEIESIKTFDALTQSSIAEMPRFQLLPASEISFDTQSREKFRENYRKAFGAVVRADPLYEAISSGAKYPGMENWLPLFYDKLGVIFDYLPADTLVVLDHLAEQSEEERFELIDDYYDARKTAQSGDYKPLPVDALYLTAQDLAAKLAGYDGLKLTPFAENNADSGFRKITKPGNDIEVLKTYQKPVLVAASSVGSRDHLLSVLKKHGISGHKLDSWAEAKKLKDKIGLLTLPLEEGFETPDFIMISEQDIFGDRFIRTVKKKRNAENFMAEAASFALGDLIVHEDHGIGQFAGLESLTVSGITHDMVRLTYADEARLFVPVENIEVITRYGGDAENVRLDKLGGVYWQERKSRLKERIKLAADALLKVAAERALKTATRYVAGEGLYEEFTARFPYTETEDQMRAIEDVLADMASGKPMDRLICGDVGFGKTEVALRAAFAVAASDNRHQALVAGPIMNEGSL